MPRDDDAAAAPLTRLARRLLGPGPDIHAADDPPDGSGADAEHRAALNALAEAHHLDSGY